jgi:hypothetical protein
MVEIVFPPSAPFPDRLMAAFGDAIEPRLQPGESLADVLAGSTKLALRRAELLRREAIPLDVEYVLAMWCWWPFKPELADDARVLLRKRRLELFMGAAAEPPEDRLDEVSDELLTHSIEGLYELQGLKKLMQQKVLKRRDDLDMPGPAIA